MLLCVDRVSKLHTRSIAFRHLPPGRKPVLGVCPNCCNGMHQQQQKRRKKEKRRKEKKRRKQASSVDAFYYSPLNTRPTMICFEGGAGGGGGIKGWGVSEQEVATES